MQFENSHNDYAIKTRAIRTEKKLSTRKVNVAKSRRIIPALARRPEPYRGTMSPTLGLPTRQRHQQYVDCFARIFVFGDLFVILPGLQTPLLPMSEILHIGNSNNMIIFFCCIPNFTYSTLAVSPTRVLDAIELHNTPSILALATEEKATKRRGGRNLQTAA